LAFALCVITCRPSEPEPSLSGTWNLSHFQDASGAWVSPPPPQMQDQPIVLSCTDNGRKGHFIARTLTNQLTGEYSYTASGSLEITHFEATYLGDAQWAIYFREALPTAHRFELTGDTLRIFYGDEDLYMHFQRGNLRR